LRERLVYKLKVLLGYLRILDLRNAQTFEGRIVKRNEGLYEGERGCVHHKRYDGHCMKQ
jgi:hypothetical protein